MVESVTTETYSYVYGGGKLLRETVEIITEEDGETATETVTQDFFYDAMGTAYAVKYNGTLYYYITNLQGDILHIVDDTGAIVVSYIYSPYGKVLSTTGTLASTLGTDNPLRYRSYYYDTDSGLYYLQSRYYDPELGRFINVDNVAYLGIGSNLAGFNLFAYCGNNPTTGYDPEGHFDWDTFFSGA